MNERMDTVLRRFRSRLSAYPPGMCPLVLYRSLLQISMNQSCGKCVPCRDGLLEADRLMRRIIEGEGNSATMQELYDLCVMIRKTSDCAVGTAAADLVLESMREFADEYESHIRDRRCMENTSQTIPCRTLCPAHVDVPGYIALIGRKDFAGAVNLIRDKNPFPTACAMVCEHPCEEKCRRMIIDDPVNIRGLKKYAVDMAPADGLPAPEANVPTGKKIAVVGAGPAGLTAAWFLGLMGHRVVVFEEHEKPGGMLRYGIPAYRLPRERLDSDIRGILSAGDIELRCNTRIGKDISFEEIRQKYDAVYLGLGAQIGNRIPMGNIKVENVIPASDFLRDVEEGHPMDLEGKRVVLIGGGNVAMDAARTAIRLGALTTHVLARRRFRALSNELESAMQEGVRFRTLLAFQKIETDKETNELRAVWMQPMIAKGFDKEGMITTEPSSAPPQRFKCDVLILCVGQHTDTGHFAAAGIPVSKGRIKADEACMIEGWDGVFAGGDCVTGPATAIKAIAAGQAAAYNIDEYLGYHHKIKCDIQIPTAVSVDHIPTARAEIAELDPFERKENFDEVEVPMTPEEAMREAGRCLRCDHFGCGSMVGGCY